jgi:hypothetical protein
MNNDLKEKRFLYLFRRTIIIGAILIPVGFNLYSGTDLEAVEFIPLFLGFTAWSLVPYIILTVISVRIQNKIVLITSAVSMLGVEILTNLSVHVFPKGSTSALLFVFMPKYQLVFIMPLILLIGFGISKLLTIFGKNKTAP